MKILKLALLGLLVYELALLALFAVLVMLE